MADEVGLLSPGASRTNLSVPASGGSGSARHSFNNPHSSICSFGVAVRFRAQSLLCPRREFFRHSGRDQTEEKKDNGKKCIVNLCKVK